MFARVEFDEEMKKFIEYEYSYTESFEEIKDLVFTEKRRNTNYSLAELMNLSFMFQNIKISALNKIKNQERLTFPEGFVIERLLAKYNHEDYISVEEHINQIKKDCSNNRKNKRDNEKKLNKLYRNFIQMISN